MFLGYIDIIGGYKVKISSFFIIFIRILINS
jgi:hypothetical protein